MLHDLGILRWLTRAWPGTHQHQTPDELRMPKGEHLGHISANREPEDILSFPNIDHTYTPTSSEQAPPAPYIRARCYRYAVPQRVCRNKIIGLTPSLDGAGSSPR
jgi:hypothetical protein